MKEEIFRFEIKDDTDDTLVGRFTYTDRPNNNGVIFPKEVMSKALAEGFMLRSDVTYGHLGSDREDYSKIDLAKTSHVLRSMYEEEEGDGYGVEVKIMNTPMGNVLKEMIDKGADLQFNAVYEGVVNEETKEVENLKFITIDIVPVKK